jgi:hypothetical protein
MRDLVRNASTAELKLLRDTLLDVDELSSEQEGMLFAVVDELTERGEFSKVTEGEFEAAFARTRQKIAELKSLPESEEPAWIDDLRADREGERLETKWRRRSRRQKLPVSQTEDPDGVLSALLKFATIEELLHLSNALSTSEIIMEKHKNLLLDIDNTLADKLKAMPYPSKKPLKKALRPVLLAASIVAVFSVTNIVAYANGVDFFGLFSKWTQDAVYFVFGNSTEEQTVEVDAEYSRLINVLNTLEMQVDLPKYIPDGYVFFSIEPDEPVDFLPVAAWFVRGDDRFSIKVNPLGTVSSHSEVNAEEQLIHNGIYLITSNLHRMKAVWHQENYEITIQGDITHDELIKILDSI